MDIAGLFQRLIPLLEAAEIPYMLTGSLASSIHGNPRSTRDIDLVIAPESRNLLRLIRSLPEEKYFASEESALRALTRDAQFNVIDYETGWKIDFIVVKKRPFSRTEFDRRSVELVDGVSVFVASPEDVLLAKLEWAKMGSSDRQITDAAGIIQTQGPSLDDDYVSYWAAELGVESELDRARREAGV